MKEGVVSGGFDTGRWITLMRSSCIILVACYLVCVTVFITAVLLKVTFNAVAQHKKIPKESFNVEDLYSVRSLYAFQCETWRFYFAFIQQHNTHWSCGKHATKTAILHRNQQKLPFSVGITVLNTQFLRLWRLFGLLKYADALLDL